VQLASLVLRRRSVYTRDAYDRFLPSTASISSTRASFGLDEIASRAHGFFTDSVFAACPGGVASHRSTQSSTQRFHDAEVALVDWRLGVCFSPERGGVFFLLARRQSNQ